MTSSIETLFWCFHKFCVQMEYSSVSPTCCVPCYPFQPQLSVMGSPSAGRSCISLLWQRTLSWRKHFLLLFKWVEPTLVKITHSALYLSLFVFCKRLFYVGLLSSETNGGTCTWLGIYIYKYIAILFLTESLFFGFATSMVLVCLVCTLEMLCRGFYLFFKRIQ